MRMKPLLSVSAAAIAGWVSPPLLEPARLAFAGVSTR